jgi:long-subunit fatty acid transport protein
MTHRTLIAGIIVVLVAATASGQAFSAINQSVANITGTGARAHGMGGAFIALADDATAASWNPAGLSQLSRPEVSIVYEDFSGSYDTSQSLLEDFTAFEDFPFTIGSAVDTPGDFESDNLAFLSATYPFQLTKNTLVMQVSYRRMASFPTLTKSGGSLAELRSGDGEVLDSFETVLNSVDAFGGGFDAYSISMATQLGGTVRLGLSANYIDMKITNHFEQVETPVDDPDLCWSCAVYSAEQSFTNWNFDVGFQWQPIRALTIGAVYHTDFNSDYKYTVTRSGEFFLPGPGETIVRPPSTSSDTTTVHYPDGWGAGIAWRPTDRLTFAVDYSEMNWSKGRIEGYMVPSWDREGEPIVREPRDVGFPFPVDQDDSWTARGGVEYVILLKNGGIIPLRAGYFEEKQFVAFNEFVGVGDAPTFDGYSIGTGFAFKNFQFDIAWIRTTGDDSKEDFYTFEEDIGRDTITVEVTETRNVDYSSDRFLASLIVRF